MKVLLTEPGLVVALNALLEAATGDVGCFLDDDAIARPLWIENLARHYERDRDVGGVAGPAIDVVDGRPLVKRARWRNRVIWPGWISDQSNRHSDRVVPSDHFRGANMSLRLEPLRRHGGFESLLLGDCFRNELGACLGIARLGYRLLFDPDAEVDHYEAPRPLDTERLSAEAVYNNAANETLVLLKSYGRFGRIAHMCYAFAVGNFPNPGLALGLAGTLVRPFWHNRFLLGLGAVGPAWRGRLRGWHMYRQQRADDGPRTAAPLRRSPDQR